MHLFRILNALNSILRTYERVRRSLHIRNIQHTHRASTVAIKIVNLVSMSIVSVCYVFSTNVVFFFLSFFLSPSVCFSCSLASYSAHILCLFISSSSSIRCPFVTYVYFVINVFIRIQIQSRKLGSLISMHAERERVRGKRLLIFFCSWKESCFLEIIVIWR